MDIISARVLASGGAGLILLLPMLLRSGRGALPLTGDWPRILLASFFNMMLFPYALMAGVTLLGPGQSAILTYTMPVWTALLAVPILGERLNRRRLIALGLGLVAVVLVAAGQAMRAEPSLLGLGLGIFAGFCFAAGTVANKALAWRSPMPVVSAWQLLVAAPPAVLLWLALPGQTYLHLGETRGLLGAGYMALFANAIAYLVWFRLVGRLSAGVAGLSLLVVPCIGVASSAALGLRPVGWPELVALLLVLAAISLVMRRPAAG
jgi:drug/metabolite transporter (DMT)-like permease